MFHYFHLIIFLSFWDSGLVQAASVININLAPRFQLLKSLFCLACRVFQMFHVRHTEKMSECSPPCSAWSAWPGNWRWSPTLSALAWPWAVIVTRVSDRGATAEKKKLFAGSKRWYPDVKNPKKAGQWIHPNTVRYMIIIIILIDYVKYTYMRISQVLIHPQVSITKHSSYSKVISLAPSLQGWKTLHSILPGLFTLLTRALRPPIAGYFGACFPHCKVYRNKVMWVMWVMWVMCKFPWLTKQIQLHPSKSRKSWQLMEFRTLICEPLALSKAPSICCKSMLAKPCRVLSLHWACQNVENADGPPASGRSKASAKVHWDPSSVHKTF